MQPSTIKHLCVLLLVSFFAFFAPSVASAQAKSTVQSQTPARSEARQAAITAQKVSASSAEVEGTVETAIMQNGTKSAQTPSETPHLEEGEQTLAKPTKAVNPN